MNWCLILNLKQKTSGAAAAQQGGVHAKTKKDNKSTKIS